MRKVSLVRRALVAALALPLFSAPANAAAPSISRVTAVVGLADRNKGSQGPYFPVMVTVRVEGTSLGTDADNSSIYLTGWNPAFGGVGGVGKIARRIRSKLGVRTKGNEVLGWESDGADSEIVVVFDVSRVYVGFESIAEFTDHIGDLRIEVRTPEGRTGPVPIDMAFRYDRWAINQPKSPIALAQGVNGDVYINSEQQPINPSVWRFPNGPVEEILIPKTEGPDGPFGLGNDTNTYKNGNGQDVTFAEGRAWFPQSGNWAVHTPTVKSQSRIVSYEPGAAPGSQIKKYIVSEDDEPIMGVLHDPYRNRIWYSLADMRMLGGGVAAGIGSIPVNNHPEGDVNAIPTPIRLNGTTYPVMMTLDHTEDHNLWFTTMDGNYLGRVGMTSACLANPAACVVDKYRLPQVFNRNLFQEMGWSIDTTDDGDIVFNLYFETALARFDVDGRDTNTDGADDGDCKVGTSDSDAPNPCITVVQVPLVSNSEPSLEAVHSMALDRERCLLWYTYYTGGGTLYRNNSIGFAPANLTGGTQAVTKLPALYGFENHGLTAATTPFSGILAGDDGSIFFTNFNTSTLGRIKPIDPYMVENCQ